TRRNKKEETTTQQRQRKQGIRKKGKHAAEITRDSQGEQKIKEDIMSEKS
ncbi:9984_t:CDS:1, partial [Ambispora gerdemannii]